MEINLREEREPVKKSLLMKLQSQKLTLGVKCKKKNTFCSYAFLPNMHRK